MFAKFKEVSGQIAPFIRPYRKFFFGSILFLILAAVLNAITPYCEGLISTRLAADVSDIAAGVEGAAISFDYVLKVLMLLGVFYVSQTLSNYASGFLMTDAIQNTMRDLRNQVQDKIRKLPVSYFDRNSYGDILSRISNDVDTISNAMQQSFSQIVNAILLLTFAIVMMFTINWQMALVALLIIPLSYLVSRMVVSYSQKIFLKQQNALGRLNGRVQEMYTGFTEIKLFGREDAAIEDFRQVNQELCENGFKAQFSSSLMNPLISFITYLAIAVCILMGSVYALGGIIAIGSLQAFVRYIWQVNQPLSQMTQLSAAIQSAVAAFERVFSFLDEEEDVPDVAQPKKLEHLRGDVEFEHVRFGYSDDKILIQDLNASVKSGQMVAIVGPTGAGKTTLINLLMRFYDVKGGSIKIDGVDIREMRREDLRACFGMVLQDTWLFHGTIRDNIGYGRLGATTEEIVSAAKAANVHHFIRTLTDGYNMVINEEASNISQGEKQLLTIARAILSDPPILILDEATSSVDTRLELMLQTAMKNLLKGRTSFVIAHRLSTIRSADLILVVNNGSIIEQGTHQQLMELGGFYEKLYNSQFANREPA